MNALRIAFACLVGLMAFALAAPVQAGPPMMDPKRASGIPRVDPQVAPGTITVRCLLGGFDQPAVGLEVSLAVTGADGTKEERKATTVEAGRATFDGLDAFVGGVAVASVSFDGQEVRSRAIPIDPSAGSRVMLVKGASSPPPGPPPTQGAGQGAGAHGGSAVPLPGQPFPLDERPPNLIVAGALDLEAGKPLPGIEVTLTARLPDVPEPKVLEQTTNEDGRAVFENLVPPEFPPGTKFQLEGVLEPGKPAEKSVEFEFEDKAIAVVLAKGKIGPADPPPAPKQRRPTMPPRVDSRVAAGTVKVSVIDANDQPVPDQSVQVVKKDVTGNDVTYEGVTDAKGVALVEGVKIQSDAFYFAGVIYDGGPYQSTFFQLPDTTGASVELRVFDTTADASLVRSGVHYETRPLENDSVQVIRIFELLVTGDEAYWPSGGMRIYGAPGSRFVKVLPRSTRWLEEREGAPYAVLTGPIPPGEVIELSIAYVVDHDGTVAIDWQAPFPVLQGGVALESGLELTKGAQGPAEIPPHQTESPVRLFKFVPEPYQPGPCGVARQKDPSFVCPELLATMGGTHIELEVSGLPTRPAVYRTLGIGFGAAIALFLGMALVIRPRMGRKQALLARRDVLIQALKELPETGEQRRRDRLLGALDRIYRQLDALSGPASGER